jgi:acetylornithine deacetylase/succinyl-diaminopimelate desuccinylase-like protein
VVTAEVRVPGRAGHAAYGGAINAIDKAIQVKGAIDRFKARWEGRNPDCKLNLGVFLAGTIPAIVPAEAILQMNITYPLGQAKESQAAGKGWCAALMRGDFEQTIQAESSQDDWLRDHPATIGWIKDVYPFRTPDDAPVVRAAQQALADVGRPAAPRPMTAWFDAAHLAVNAGVSVVGLGSGKEGAAHGATEHILIDDMVAGAQAVALALHSLLCSENASELARRKENTARPGK